MSIENLVIKRMLYSSVFRLLSIINQRIRKDKKIILFYCNSTGGFRDNFTQDFGLDYQFMKE